MKQVGSLRNKIKKTKNYPHRTLAVCTSTINKNEDAHFRFIQLDTKHQVNNLWNGSQMEAEESLPTVAISSGNDENNKNQIIYNNRTFYIMNKELIRFINKIFLGI